MFLPLFIFVAILIVPIIISLILIRIVHIDETIPQSHVSASYWGKYPGVGDAPYTGTIALHNPTINLDAPTKLPPHAVAWHP